MHATLTLPLRRPYHVDAMVDFLAAHVVPGLEAVEGSTYARVLALPGGPAAAAMTITGADVEVEVATTDPADVAVVEDVVHDLLDLGTDGAEVDRALLADRTLAPLVRADPGVRVPGSVDGHETAVRTVVGQQVSVSGAQTVVSRIVHALGAPVEGALARRWGLTHAFPTPEALAGADPTTFSMPRARGATVQRVAAAVAGGALELSRAADPRQSRAALLALRGIGPWTADYVAMRALRDPDVLLVTDLVLRRELEARGLTAADADRWRPWRSYAGMHLWRAAAPALTRTPSAERTAP